MQSMPLAAFEARVADYDAMVARTPGVDRFCTGSPWVLPAHEALMPPREPWICRSDHGWLLLARSRDAQFGTYLQPLEALWGFAAPIAGEESEALAADVADALREDEPNWHLLLMSGLSRASPFFRALAARLSGRYRLGVGGDTSRRVASLEGGVEGYLSRRSGHFRANVRRARRRAREAGITFDFAGAADPEALFARVLDVEWRSWKGQEGVGIQSGTMREFYARMIPRLSGRSALRAVFAVHEGRDVAYAFGGVSEGLYRGLQMSYDQAFTRASLGDATQLALIEHLCEEAVDVYDMGQDIAYKHHWSESAFVTVTLIGMR